MEGRLMSLSELTARDVEDLLEGHKWYRSAREKTVWSSGQGRYVGTGEIIPERWVTIKDGKTSWDEYEYALGDDGVEVEGLGSVFLEYQFGGEGQGDDYYIVLRVE